MKTVLRSFSFAVCIAASASAMAAPGGADVIVTPTVNGGFVVKNNAGNAERLRVMETGDVYLPHLPNTSEADNLACYDNTTGRLAKCAASAVTGSLPWVRSVAGAPGSIAIPLGIGIPTVLGQFTVIATQAGNYMVNWMVSVQPPQVAAVVTCGAYRNGVLVPGSETQDTFDQSTDAVHPLQGTALVTGVQAGDVIAPGCGSNALGTFMKSARIVVQQVGDAQVTSPLPD